MTSKIFGLVEAICIDSNIIIPSSAPISTLLQVNKVLL